MNNQTLSIYLHIPFCTTKCSYCAFNTYTNMEHLIEQFVAAMITEIKFVGTQVDCCLPVGSIYFGGGTPSLLNVYQIERILSTINTHYTIISDAEVSIEANPNDLSLCYLSQLIQLGVTRLSVGMQSANLHELTLFRRRHNMDDVIEAIEVARRAGFDNVNLDLIYGAPHQTLKSWETSLSRLMTLCPEHISLYALGLEYGTAMYIWVEKGYLPHPDDDLAADMYDLASAILEVAGYKQYEISNWSKQGHECRHNLQYWRNLAYIGFGPGAHSFANGYRYANILSPIKYIQILNAYSNEPFEFPKTPVVDDIVAITEDVEIAETLIMGLRLTDEGVRRRNFVKRFGVDVLDVYGEILQRYQQYGLLEISAEFIRITRQGRLLSNILLREFV